MKKTLFLLVVFFSSVLILISNDDLTDHWRVVDSFYNFNPRAMNCTDSLNCFVVGNLYGAEGAVMRRTTDGGFTWKTFWADTSIFYFDSNLTPHYSYRAKRQIYSIACPSNDLWLAGLTLGRMMRSTNMGASWDSIDFVPRTYVSGIRMFDNKFGAFILDTNIMLTLDGGLKWSKIIMPDTGFFPNRIQLLSLGGMIITGGRSNSDFMYIYKTIDYGTTWKSNILPNGTNSIFFQNDKLGWGLGGYVNHHYDDTLPSHEHSHNGATIFKTSDGGETWIEKLNLYDTTSSLIWPFTLIRFSDLLNGIAIGVENMLYSTSDGGETWKRESNDSIATSLKYSIGTIEIKGKTRLITGILDKIYKYFEDPLGIAEESQFITNDLMISPNPVTDYLSVKLKDEKSNLQIFNLLGNKLIDIEYLDKIDVSGLAPGMYFVRIGTQFSKFVKL